MGASKRYFDQRGGRNQYDLDPEDTIVNAALTDAKATVKKAGRMSPNMKWTMRQFFAGRKPGDWLSGGAMYGGFEQLEYALRRRGLLDVEGKISEDGNKYVRALTLIELSKKCP